MLSTTVLRTSLRGFSKSLQLSRNPAALSSGRYFATFGDSLAKKEKVEEDRFMREQEKKFIEKKRAEMAEHSKEEEMKVFEETVAPVMAEVQALLSKTGDKVSTEALENLVKWKNE